MRSGCAWHSSATCKEHECREAAPGGGLRAANKHEVLGRQSMERTCVCSWAAWLRAVLHCSEAGWQRWPERQCVDAADGVWLAPRSPVALR